jgi:hypothetical protein
LICYRRVILALGKFVSKWKSMEFTTLLHGMSSNSTMGTSRTILAILIRLVVDAILKKQMQSPEKEKT